MNQQQAQIIVGQSEQINNINFDDLIKNLYPNITDIENITIQQLTIVEFVQLSKRVFSQFISEFKDRNNYIILPFFYNNPQYGGANLDGQIQNYFQQLNAHNILNAENILFWLIGYQIENGFFHKKPNKQSEHVHKNIAILAEKLNILEIDIENQLKIAQKISIELDQRNKEIEVFINQKRDELITISNNLSTSTNQSNQINDLLAKSIEQSTRLNTIVEQQEQNKTQAENKLQEIRNIYEKTNWELTQNIKNVQGLIGDFGVQIEKHDSHLKFVEDKRDFFEERINYLRDLIGQEVGVNLFKTFNTRKDELQKPVIFWRWAVPAMAVITIGWIFFLFYHQSNNMTENLWWQAFAINTIKSVPAVFLLFFAIKQYGKERNFQEEYAFKSAVALTIDAYAGRISDIASKDKLIMDAVFNVYKTPIEDKRKNKNPSKNVLDTIKSMSDTTAAIVNKSK